MCNKFRAARSSLQCFLLCSSLGITTHVLEPVHLYTVNMCTHIMFHHRLHSCASWQEGDPSWVVESRNPHAKQSVHSTKGIHPLLIQEVDAFCLGNSKPANTVSKLRFKYAEQPSMLALLPSVSQVATRKKALTKKTTGAFRFESLADFREWANARTLPSAEDELQQHISTKPNRMVVLPGMPT